MLSSKLYIVRTTGVPGIVMVWLHPHLRRTTGDMDVTGDVFKRPVSFLAVRFTYMRSRHEPDQLP